MSKPAGKCVFCDGPGLTKGHVWPDWLNNILQDRATHHGQATGFFFTFSTEIPGPEKVVRQRQGHARSRKPRNTCKKCNNEWMSEIEADAIPVATPLIKGESFRLDEIGQRKLAAFLCLMTMRMEFLGAMRAIPPSDRLYLMEHFQPPPAWMIWIAAFVGDQSDEYWARYCGMHVTSLPPAEKIGAEHCNTQVTTMIIGKLCAHLFCSTEMPPIGYEGISLTKIWPPSGFHVDSRFLPAVDDKAALWLHEALARESKAIPGISHGNPPFAEGDQ